MVVCQYFLQGWCKFGKYCRNEHIQQNVARSNTAESNKLYDELIVELVASERGRQWPLSCFAPLKNRSIPNLIDVSPEEMRYNFYSAKLQGAAAVEQHLASVKESIKNAEKIRSFLKQPSPELTKLLNDMLSITYRDSNLATTDTPSGNVQSNFRFDMNATGTNSGLFANAASAPSGSIFGSSSEGSIFSQPSANNFTSNTTSIFGSGQSSQNTPIFAKQSQLYDAQSTVTPQFQQNQNVFTNVNQPPGVNIFGGFPQAPPNYQPINVPSPQNIFSANVNSQNSVFGGSEPQKNNVINNYDLAYSKLEDLTEDEKKIFEAPMFQFGKIPLKPPAQNYC